MSTVVCQGSHHVEATTMRLKLVAPKSLGLTRGLSIADSDKAKEVREKCHVNDEFFGFCFLQSLSSQTPKKEMETEPSYVHPLVKQSSMRLSGKSLELCTESLGSETGSDTSESTIFSPSSLEYSTNGKSIIPREERNLHPQMEPRKVISRNFPPPLTSISGSNSLQARPHREGGRLIIQATETPSTNAYFQAERSHGRLHLSFWQDAEENEESGEEDEIADVENEHSDEERAEEQGDDGGNEGYGKKDVEGNCFDVEVECGMEKFPRPSRCKEDQHHGNKGLCNWESFWVATS